jgi:hypothetical protein
MSLGEYRTHLRGATARADSPGLVELLTSGPWPKSALQLVGDAVLVVVAGGVSEAAVLARRCVAALGEGARRGGRCRPGDGLGRRRQ